MPSGRRSPVDALRSGSSFSFGAFLSLVCPRVTAYDELESGLQGNYNTAKLHGYVNIPHGDILLFGAACGQIVRPPPPPFADPLTHLAPDVLLAHGSRSSSHRLQALDHQRLARRRALPTHQHLVRPLPPLLLPANPAIGRTVKGPLTLPSPARHWCGREERLRGMRLLSRRTPRRAKRETLDRRSRLVRWFIRGWIRA